MFRADDELFLPINDARQSAASLLSQSLFKIQEFARPAFNVAVRRLVSSRHPRHEALLGVFETRTPLVLANREARGAYASVVEQTQMPFTPLDVVSKHDIHYFHPEAIDLSDYVAEIGTYSASAMRSKRLITWFSYRRATILRALEMALPSPLILAAHLGFEVFNDDFAEMIGRYRADPSDENRRHMEVNISIFNRQSLRPEFQ